MLTPMSGEKVHIPNRRWNSKIVWKRIWNPKSILMRDRPDRGDHSETHHGIMVKPKVISGSLQANVYTVITCNHHVKLYVPTEESFPIPLKYIDVTRTTDTTFDVMLEKSIDDYWK